MYASCDLKISEKMKSLFRRQPPTAEEFAARAEVQSERDQIREDEAVVKGELDASFRGPFGGP